MIYQITAPQFSKMLKNLDAILEKAEHFAKHKKIEMEVLLNSRLAPDQFNLTRQIQIACDMAKICIAKLTTKNAPVHDDKEGNLGQLRQRIAETIHFIESCSEKDFAGSIERRVTTPRWEGKFLLGNEYVIQHSIPNFYFHITTAYDILRHNGVEIGKKDYLGLMPFKMDA
jgi:uncharacterized protein